ncbi:MAG: hypothetical protein RBT76_03760 [candidate division Zixibacteria bacterium]|jgi:hypothetical protein|nr:hypothetical protein [candidate division Zixibacteria bacterium]
MKCLITTALSLALACSPISFPLADQSGEKNAEKPMMLTPNSNTGVSQVRIAPDTEQLKIDFVYHDAEGRQHPAWLGIDANGFAVALSDHSGRDRISFAASGAAEDRVDAGVAIGNDRLTVVGPPDEKAGLTVVSLWQRYRVSVTFASRAEADSAISILRATPDYAARARLSGRDREVYAKADRLRTLGRLWTDRLTGLGLLNKESFGSPEKAWTVWQRLCTMVSPAKVEDLAAQRNMSAIIDAIKTAVQSIGNDEPGS